MKIVVIGGTGLIGSKLVERLRKEGHDPLAAAPETGVNTITGEVRNRRQEQGARQRRGGRADDQDRGMNAAGPSAVPVRRS